jgi:hypothetical protein
VQFAPICHPWHKVCCQGPTECVADAWHGLGSEDKVVCRAQKPGQLATCDGPPDHTYKVAYDEAGALLAQLSGR